MPVYRFSLADTYNLSKACIAYGNSTAQYYIMLLHFISIDLRRKSKFSSYLKQNEKLRERDNKNWTLFNASVLTCFTRLFM